MGRRVNTYGIGDRTLDNFMMSMNTQMRGFMSVSMCMPDWFSTAKYRLFAIQGTAYWWYYATAAMVVMIEAGSLIEVDGDIYQIETETKIRYTDFTEGVWYLKAVPSGGSITIELTQTTPIFNRVKRGWYGEDASASHRYIVKLYKDDSPPWYELWMYLLNFRFMDRENMYAL